MTGLSLFTRKVMSMISPLLPDELYLKILYRMIFKRRINLKTPTTFNEKLQWLKLHDKREIYTDLVDKYKSRFVVERILGSKDNLIPLLGVWDRFEMIDFDSLPRQFVLKTNHDSQGVVVCKNKDEFNYKQARKKLTRCLNHNYYWNGREYPYRNVERKIIAEQYMEDPRYGELRDYKFFCFEGVCKFFFIATGRSTGNVMFDFFDRDLNPIPVIQGHPHAPTLPDIPDNIEEMIQIAEKLSAGFPQIRIDLYNIQGKIYVGEFTIFHFGGLKPFIPDSYDEFFGQYIHLPMV